MLTHFSLISQNTLEVEVSDKRSSQTHRIDLREVADTPKHAAFKAGVFNTSISLMLTVTMVFLFSAMIASRMESNFLVTTFGCLSLFFGMVGFFQYKRHQSTSYDVFIYEDQHGRQCFTIDADKDGGDESAAFRAKVETTIKSISGHHVFSSNPANSISERIASLKTLFEQGVLSEAEFMSAKARVLDSSQRTERAIGFGA